MLSGDTSVSNLEIELQPHPVRQNLINDHISHPTTDASIEELNRFSRQTLLQSIQGLIGCSFGLYWWMKSGERAVFKSRFHSHCSDRATQLGYKITRALETISDISSLFGTFYPSLLNQTLFHTYTKMSSGNFDWITFVYFAPKVDHDFRETWERDYGTPLTPFDNSTDMNSTQEFYYPISYVSPDSSLPVAMVGRNIMSDETRRKIVMKAMLSKKPALSNRVLLATNNPGVVLCLPTQCRSPYTNDQPTLCMVIAGFELNVIFNSTSLKLYDQEGMMLEIIDTPTNDRLFEHSSKLHYAYDFRTKISVTFIDRQYDVICIPSEKFYRSHITSMPLVILVLAIGSTLLLIVIAHALMRKYSMIRNQEAEKHRQLEESKMVVDSLTNYSKAIVKALPDPLLFIGNNQIKGANELFLKKTGYSHDELINGPQPIPVQTVIPSLCSSYTLESSEIEVKVKRRDGSTFFADISVSNFYDRDGNERRQVILLRDLTEKKGALEALSAAKLEAQKAHQAKTEILYFLCHEIRNPIHVILGLTEAMPAQQDCKEELRGIVFAAEFMESLVDDVLALLGIKSESPLQLIIANLGIIVDTVYERIVGLACDKDIKLKFNIDRVQLDVQVRTDLYRIQTIISKLLLHSIKVTPSKGTVTFSVKLLPDSHHLQQPAGSSDAFRIVRFHFLIADNSGGYDAEDVPKLFDPFNLNHSASLGKDFGGVGLGFALSAQFIQTLGGKMDFRSERGKGNLVSFELPFKVITRSHSSPNPFTAGNNNDNRAATFASTPLSLSPSSTFSPCRARSFRKQHSEIEQVAVEGNHSHNDTTNDIIPTRHRSPSKPTLQCPSLQEYQPSLVSPRVLLVEDNEVVQRMSARLLRKEGLDVVTADNGNVAVDMFKSGERFDVILMDLIMPVLDGHLATVSLRKLGCKSIIIAVTANALDEEWKRCQKEGFNDFVTKPATGKRLVAVIDNWIGIWENRKGHQ